MATKAYKFRLFTNANQERELAAMLETSRRLYNAVLSGIELCWETAGARWNVFEQGRWFTKQRKLNPYYSRLPSDCGTKTLRRLNQAFEAFFRRIKRGERPGYPRFKSADRFNSFEMRHQNGAVIVNGKLRILNVGTIRVRWHREMIATRIRRIIIRREADKWFACFVVDVPDVEPKTNADSVGIDVGLNTFVATSDGEQLGDSRTLESRLPELRRRKRALSRCKRGSNRRKFVKQRVQRLYAKVRNVRKDMHHKVARSLVDRYGTIVAENLNVAGMLRNRRLARRISDAAWGNFVRTLQLKAESAGVQVVLVDAKNTSQQCSNCGEMVRKSLAVRVHTCACGCVLDRDENAARNILGRAGPKSHNVGDSLHGSKSHCLVQ